MWGRSGASGNTQSQQQSNSFGGGRGGYSGGRDGGRGRNFRGGRGRGRGGRYDSTATTGSGSSSSTTQEPPTYDICKFYVRDGSCRFGDSCRNSHAIVTLIALKAHENPIKCLGVVEASDSPRILSGSTDSTIKVWNLGAEKNIDQPEFVIPTKGPVQCIEVSGGTTILYSADEPLDGDNPSNPVAIVHLLNQTNMTTIPILRSEEFPYTHSSQVRGFKVVSRDGQTYVVTAGGDTMIRTWRYDQVSSKFELLATMEGHIRAVTCLLLQDAQLWSGSIDQSIRVWDVGSGRCLGVLKASTTAGVQSGFGHTDAVSCLELIPAVASASSGGAAVGATDAGGSESYIASGGGDGEVKLWRTNGEYAHSCSHGAFVTALKYFQDTYGGPGSLIIGLVDGRVMMRSAITMELLIVLDGALHQNQPVWALASIGQSCFAAGGDSGFFVVCRTQHALTGSTQQ